MVDYVGSPSRVVTQAIRRERELPPKVAKRLGILQKAMQRQTDEKRSYLANRDARAPLTEIESAN